MIMGELFAVGRDPHVWCRGKTYSFPPIVSGVRFRDRGLYYVEESTQKPSVVLCIFRIPGRIMDLIK